jgi:hypothetical protein
MSIFARLLPGKKNLTVFTNALNIASELSSSEAEITVAQAEETVTLPPEAVVTFAGIEKVFVVEQGQAREINVVTGRRSPTGSRW